ncbi:MAG: sugar ABC transporter ATP-binding protein [Nitrospinota bacterium]
MSHPAAGAQRRAGTPGLGLLLCVRGINKSFPGVRALRGVDFDLRRGEVHVLLGENGAGKSTLMKILSGAYVADRGLITIDGEPVQIGTPRRAQELGIGIIYQELNLVPNLDVAENLFLGREEAFGRLRIRRKAIHAKAREILGALQFDIDPYTLAEDLGVGQQQMVAIAKAVSQRSRILIFDEPTSSLTDHEIEILFRTLRRLKEQGVGIIYISHRLNEVHVVGDRVTVLRDGCLIGTRHLSTVTVPDLVRMMVGRDLTEMFHRDRVEAGEEALRIEGLSREGVLRDVSLVVRRGEIVGIAGLVGAGRSELARAVFGIDEYDSGRVYLAGREVTVGTPSKAIRMGVALAPENRKEEGLCLNLNVQENIILAGMRSLFRRGHIQPRVEQDLAEHYVKELRIATPSTKTPAMSLSGGTQQKVVLAKWLCSRAKVFIFDEPTRGIDVGAKVEVHDLMNQLAREGAAVLMISSELPEVLGMSDRIYVMCEGRIAAEFDRAEATQEKILTFAMGGHAA